MISFRGSPVLKQLQSCSPYASTNCCLLLTRIILIVGYQTHWLAHADLARARHGSISTRIVLVETHRTLHYVWIRFSGVGIEVDHHATKIAHRQTNYWTIFTVAKHEPAADPTIFAERFSRFRRNHDIWPESSLVQILSDFAADAGDRCEIDHRDGCVVKDSISEFHQLHRTAELFGNYVLQLRAAERERQPLGRTHVRRQWLAGILVKTNRLIQQQLRKTTGA